MPSMGPDVRRIVGESLSETMVRSQRTTVAFSKKKVFEAIEIPYLESNWKYKVTLFSWDLHVRLTLRKQCVQEAMPITSTITTNGRSMYSH